MLLLYSGLAQARPELYCTFAEIRFAWVGNGIVTSYVWDWYYKINLPSFHAHVQAYTMSCTLNHMYSYYHCVDILTREWIMLATNQFVYSSESKKWLSGSNHKAFHFQLNIQISKPNFLNYYHYKRNDCYSLFCFKHYTLGCIEASKCRETSSGEDLKI